MEGCIINPRNNHGDIRKACAYMIIVDGLPFSFLENEGFRHFMSVACPSFQIPSRTAIARDCYELYLEEKDKLKSFLKYSAKMISLTTDSWTSEEGIRYLCLTAHFIDDDWVLHKKVLSFCPIDSCKGMAIREGVLRCLLDWGIDNVFSITVDNASSNDPAISYLKKTFSNWGTSFLGDKYLHVRCLTNIINLVVFDGLEDIKSSVSRVREAIRYIIQSPSRLKEFKRCVKMERIETERLLCLDVPNRWNSTYLMLDTASMLAKAFESFENEDPNYKIDLQIVDGLLREIDWRNISCFVRFLEQFHELTLRISGLLYVTSNQVLHEIGDMAKLLSTWEESDDVSFSQMAKRMKDKYNKYLGSPEKLNFILFYAVILDPLFKYDYVKWVIGKMYPDNVNLADKVKEGFYALFDEYRKLSCSQESHDHTSSLSIVSSLISTQCSQDSFTPPLKRRALAIDTRGEYKMLKKINETELDIYFGEESEEGEDDFNILKWWKLNASRFPILAQMARDILAIPVSTVASESAFSKGGRVLDPFKSSLPPRMVQCLICARNWLRNEAYPVRVEEDIGFLERIDKEFEKEVYESTKLDL